MRAKVKNMLEWYEKSKTIKVRKRRFVRVGRRRPASIHILYQELKNVIICNDENLICPKRWEELNVDFKHTDSRYYPACDKTVLKVTNQHNFDEIQDSDKCIAVPLNGKLYKSLSKELKANADRYIVVQISRMMLCEASYSYDSIIHSDSAKEILKKMFDELDDGMSVNRFTDECERYGVDFIAMIEVLKRLVFHSDRIKI